MENNIQIVFYVIIFLAFLISGIIFIVDGVSSKISYNICEGILSICVAIFSLIFLVINMNDYEEENAQSIQNSKTQDYTVYINGVETKRELIDLDKYTNSNPNILFFL